MPTITSGNTNQTDWNSQKYNLRGDLARDFAGMVHFESGGWELTAPVTMSLVCFRYAPAGMSEPDIARVNAAIMEHVNAAGRAGRLEALVDRATGIVFDRMDAMVEISTEDDQNFRKNLVTVLAEERLALAVYRPEAFVKGDFAAAATAATKV